MVHLQSYCIYCVCITLFFSGESSPSIISCPFCRHETQVPDEEVRVFQQKQQFTYFLMRSRKCFKQTRDDVMALSQTVSSLSGVVDGGWPTHPGCSVVSGPSPAWRRRRRRRRSRGWWWGGAESHQSNRWNNSTRLFMICLHLKFVL